MLYLAMKNVMETLGMENSTIDFLERNSTNNNTTEYYINEHLKNARNILPIFTVIITMIAIGADVSWNQIYTGIRKPIGPAIGLFCQFIIMPLIGFLYNIIFQFESSVAAGLLIISCCPGGTVSNMFTYYLDGDVSLSVTMTTISIVASLGMMPLNLWMYARNTGAKNLIIPYGNIALSLLMIVSPITVGMIIKWKAPKIASYITKWVNAIASWKIFVTSAFLPATGIIIGYAIAFICKRTKSACTAIGIESGIQNYAVAYGIILLSFDINKDASIFIFPMFHAISQCLICFTLCVIYHFVKKNWKTSQYQIKRNLVEDNDFRENLLLKNSSQYLSIREAHRKSVKDGHFC
ncbi:solute carrier family 10 member 6-like [Centruroides sculpturatus]|uniref:solute carrier family 10 member 6-like n=1 Tax=Centruroides sculpturatus TaxID=218467 RepID=UPI000C6EFC4A|nr:solute carrier family 10 member 6-like [Centruroides sculpturatus]